MNHEGVKIKIRCEQEDKILWNHIHDRPVLSERNEVSRMKEAEEYMERRITEAE